MAKILSLDIGASSIKSGLVDITGIISEEKRTIIKEESYSGFIDAVKSIMVDLSEKPAGIVAALPGGYDIENDEILLGNSKILNEYNVENVYSKDEEEFTKKGNSIVYVANENKILALIGVNDIIRENSKDIIRILNNNNIQTVMLTGDHKETAEKIAKDIGITKVIANVLPSEKAKTIKELKQENRYVMMCGDGINDSPALASSDIGVSMNSGTDIAMDSSDVILTKSDLTSIINLIKISKKTIRNIKQNLFWAFFYNCLMIPIAMGLLKPIGISINPMIASVAMVFSSITVILNASRLKSIKFD